MRRHTAMAGNGHNPADPEPNFHKEDGYKESQNNTKKLASSPESVDRIATSYSFEAVFSVVLAHFKPRVFWWSDIQTGIDMDTRTL